MMDMLQVGKGLCGCLRTAVHVCMAGWSPLVGSIRSNDLCTLGLLAVLQIWAHMMRLVG